MSRIFLLSPANSSGVRARMLLREHAKFDLAARLRDGEASIGEVYAFISGLYFRGKLAYGERFAAPPDGVPGVLVITPGAGLLPSTTLISASQLSALGQVSIDVGNAAYREPLCRDAQLLRAHTPQDCEFVLLGSVATDKYVEPLIETFGRHLMFPPDFVGRGDMSRGGLTLRCSRSGTELLYAPVETAVRHGPRPARLPKLPRNNPA